MSWKYDDERCMCCEMESEKHVVVDFLHIYLEGMGRL